MFRFANIEVLLLLATVPAFIAAYWVYSIRKRKQLEAFGDPELMEQLMPNASRVRPTVKFAIGDFSIKRITVPMTQINSPYNTYRVNGLPPGPIRLPEKSTIDAVLNAPQHDYLYMCARADFSGYHDFTRDYASHLDNAHRYQAALNSRGIK